MVFSISIPNHEHRLIVGSSGKKKEKKIFCRVQLNRKYKLHRLKNVGFKQTPTTEAI